MATDRTTEHGTSVEGWLRPAVLLEGSPGTQEVGEARDPHPGDRVARYLDVASLVGLSIVVGIGIFLMAFGITLAFTVDSGSAYPNDQHITVTPFPVVK